MWVAIAGSVAAVVVAALLLVTWRFASAFREEIVDVREEMHNTRAVMETLFRARVAAVAEKRQMEQAHAKAMAAAKQQVQEARGRGLPSKAELIRRQQLRQQQQQRPDVIEPTTPQKAAAIPLPVVKEEELTQEPAVAVADGDDSDDSDEGTDEE